MRKKDDFAGLVLVLAPTGKDGALAVTTLGQSEIAAARGDLKESQLAARITDALLIARKRWSLRNSRSFSRPRPSTGLVGHPCHYPDEHGGATRWVGARSRFSARAERDFCWSAFRVVTLLSTVRVALRARRRQREVRDLLAQREMVLSSISDAFSALDSEWRYIYLNDRVAQHSGLSREQIIGRKIWDVFPQLVGGEFHQRCLRALAEKRADHFEHFHEQWGLWLETRIYPAADGLVISGPTSRNERNGSADARKRAAAAGK
jgi:PAS domain S-box-containing protein